jgi:hypothetical protein
MSVKSKSYCVLYRDISLEIFDAPLGFFCEAKDSEEAESICERSNPHGDVVWVVEDCTDLKAAFHDYYTWDN